MRPNNDPSVSSSSEDEGVVFVEHGIRHSFQYDSTTSDQGRKDAFLRLNFVTVYVADQERSKRFFLEQLGFRLMIDAYFPSGYRWIEVAPPDGSARLALVAPAPGLMEDGRPGRSSLITFTTEDVEGKYKEWSGRGVKFSVPPHTPVWGGLFCRFEDLDGNPFGLAGFNDVTRAIETRREAEAKRREAERLATRELNIAREVQARLLPQTVPAIPAIDCAGICLQARSVGGDYYDFLELGGNHLGIVVGDIAGKGIGAALLMANLQASLRSQSVRLVDHPESALALVNRMLFQNTEPGAYATLFYADCDPASHQLRYSNCGHLPGLLLRGTQVEKLCSTNTVIGLFEPWECSVLETSIGDGDILVVCTDGVVEAFGESEQEFGETRLIEAIRRNQNLSARLLAEAIVKDVVRFGGDQQYDDITVVVLKKDT